jgi:hypothetical protein
VASFAMIGVPFLASGILIASKLNVPISGTDWFNTYAELYWGGLLMFCGGTLFQLACPRTILRFPLEDEYLVYCASVRTAHKQLQTPMVAGDKSQNLTAQLVHAAVDSPDAHLEKWRRDDGSRTWLRVTTALLLGTGAVLVFFYLFYRVVHNINAIALVAGSV